MFSPDHNNPYAPYRELVLRQARAALEDGVRAGHAPKIAEKAFPEILREARASFVTLEKGGRLRGCIGHLEAVQPLILDIVENTVAAALEDPRFPPVTADEVPGIAISISILTPPEAMAIHDEADLLKQLRPGVDGLILSEGRRRATFLPSVWEELPDPAEFVRHLKNKAGWHSSYWSNKITAQRYGSIYLSESEDR